MSAARRTLVLPGRFIATSASSTASASQATWKAPTSATVASSVHTGFNPNSSGGRSATIHALGCGTSRALSQRAQSACRRPTPAAPANALHSAAACALPAPSACMARTNT